MGRGEMQEPELVLVFGFLVFLFVVVVCFFFFFLRLCSEVHEITFDASQSCKKDASCLFFSVQTSLKVTVAF